MLSEVTLDRVIEKRPPAGCGPKPDVIVADITGGQMTPSAGGAVATPNDQGGFQSARTGGGCQSIAYDVRLELPPGAP